MGDFLRKIRISSFQIIILSFLFAIIIGTLLLMLPFATAGDSSAPFTDALFTSTSAVCVTGLIVHDTALYWSLFGQIVILCLIQIGGMGIMTVALMIVSISGKKIGLIQRSAMQEAISAPTIGGIVKMTGFIFRTVVIIELLGTILLAIVFCPDLGFFKGIWYALFHSVSAFCNAGFDLMGIHGEYSSLTPYANNPIVNITVILLIITGGIGFFVWDDIRQNKWHIKRYSLQSKVVFTVTAILIALPTIYFFFTEFSGEPLDKRIIYSLFQSVSPRTAGFNTVNLNSVSETGVMLTIILMIIGGSPGSTAGGMKTTTAAVLFSSALSVFRRKGQAHIYRRGISDFTIKQASTIFVLYITLFAGSSLIISSVEKIPILTALFEAASAIGTVGLTLGITPGLSQISRLLLILLMYFGRVGGLTLIFAAMPKRKPDISKYPNERITVG